MNPKFFVMLRFNNQYPMDIRCASPRLVRFDARVDQKLLGHSWASKPHDVRTQFIAFPEGRRSKPHSIWIDGLHYHILLTPPLVRLGQLQIDDFEAIIKQSWLKFVPSGDIDVQPVEGVSAVAAYVTKHILDKDSIGLEYFQIAPFSE